MDTRLKNFLDLIAWSEGTSTSPLTKNDGYDVIVSGVTGPEVFTSYEEHPFASGRAPKVIRALPRLESTAAGRYQVILRFWKDYKALLRLPDFSAASQDAVAIQQIRECRAIPMIESGDIAGAVKACSNIWASLPGNDYGQAGGHKIEALLAEYDRLAGGVTATA